jgi:hypothetical protein
VPYWDVLTMSLHAQGKNGAELVAAREARRRFADRVAGYQLEARALAGQRKLGELEALWHVMRDRTRAAGTPVGDYALETGDELQAHGDSTAALSWYRRAEQEYAYAEGAGDGAAARWGRARVAARLERWQEALTLGQGLVSADSTSLQYRGFTGAAAARLGRRDLAETILRQLTEEHRPYTLGHAQFEAARVAAALGRLDQASSLLVSAYARGYPYDIEFHRDPSLKAIPGRRGASR